MRSLKGKVAVITGAASGIGRATALALAGEGARVHLVDIDEARNASVRQEAEAAGAIAITHRVDCSRPDEMILLAKAIQAREGRVDILHNNAGICFAGPVEDLGLEEWHRMTDVNLWGVVHGIHAFLPLMIAQKGGHIINTSSMAGMLGLPFFTAYCATKFAIVGLSEALSAELAFHNIHVTVVCSGVVRTNLLNGSVMKLPGPWGRRVEGFLDRWASSPERIAGLILEAISLQESLVIDPRELMPLWLLKRLSLRLYQSAARALTRGALGRIPGAR